MILRGKPMAVKSRSDTMRSTLALGQIILDAKLINEEQLKEAQQASDSSNVRIGDVLIQRGWISPESLAMALSLHLSLPIIDLKRHCVAPEALSLLPEALARRHNLLPLDIIDDALAVVMEDPTDLQVVEELTTLSAMRIMPMVGVRSDVRSAIDLYYRAGSSIEKEIAEFAPTVTSLDELDGPRRIDITAEDPVVRAVDMILEQGVRDRASDMHVQPFRDKVLIRYRVDGLMRQFLSLPKASHQPLLSRIKVLANMNIAESRRPQDGQFSLLMEGTEIFFRVATSLSTWGEMAVLRILGRPDTILDLPGLGFLPESLDAFSSLIHAPFGMILVSGPTGSGKTTTLYAAVNELDSTHCNIMTIEDPVEYDFAGVNQIQVNRAASITFASGLRAIMRLDPDIIMVGEVRDGETAETATQAALTGHLVLSSIHANDAPGALIRLSNLGVERYLLVSGVTGAVSQRLVRRICPHCKTVIQPTPEMAAPYEHVMDERLQECYVGEGCNFCSQTGYMGRTGVFEVLVMDDELQQLMLAGASASEIKATAVQRGMLTMPRDGMLKVKMGITTVSEVIRNVYTIG